MLPWLEFEDKSVEKAINRACEELNIPKEELTYDVISYGSTGIFGLVGTKKAKIRVVLPEPDSEETHEKERLEEHADRFQEKRDKAEKEPNRSDKDDVETQTYPDESVELGRVVLQRIVDFITEGAEISVDKGSERILFKVIGGNTAVLIGKRGRTLEAIQYLVEKVVNKRIESRVRMQIDVEGYLQTRKTNLQRMAERMAEKSKRTGKPVTIGQMNAHDRRIVHLALKHDDRVRTQSMGDGYYRKLVIFPKKKYSQNRK